VDGRAIVTILLVAGFSLVGVYVAVSSLLLASALSSWNGPVGEILVIGLVELALGAALLVVAPAVALVLLARRARAGNVVATLYGALVVVLTATHVREGMFHLALHLAGLVLVLCAFPHDDPLESAA
jgi:hypothetical protein